MKHILLVVALSAAGAVRLANPALGAEPGMTVAIFDFTAKDRSLEETGALIADLTRAQLTARGNLRLVTRDDMAKILEEQKLAIAGVTEDAAPRVGKLLGAQVVVVGRLFDLNGQLFVTAKVIGIETSRVYGEMINGDRSKVDQLSAELAAKVAGLIDKGADTLVAKVKIDGSRIETLKKKIGAANLPRVFVHVNEQIAGARPPDPAAQTEIQNILLKAGLEVVKDRDGVLDKWAETYAADGGKSAPPIGQNIDVVILGEGFCQFAARTGDLVSSRARVELEALDVKSGRVLASDRETSTALDLAETIAAKTALQNTAGALAYRLLPDAVTQWRSTAQPKQP